MMLGAVNRSTPSVLAVRPWAMAGLPVGLRAAGLRAVGLIGRLHRRVVDHRDHLRGIEARHPSGDRLERVVLVEQQRAREPVEPDAPQQRVRSSTDCARAATTARHARPDEISRARGSGSTGMPKRRW